MIVTIHQPSYLPWIPFLEKGLQSDVYVLLDTVQFEKNSEQNRNRIKTAQGERWLTVPVSRSLDSRIPEVEIAGNGQDWRMKHRRAIEENYRKSPGFELLAPALFEILEAPWTHLLDLNLALDRLFLAWAGFQGRLMRASEMRAEGTGCMRILELCRELGASTYLSGVGGLDYLDTTAFEQAGIAVLYQRYQNLPYPQRFPKLGFLPRLSALDLFMNLGPGETAKQTILRGARWLPEAEARALRNPEEMNSSSTAGAVPG